MKKIKTNNFKDFKQARPGQLIVYKDEYTGATGIICQINFTSKRFLPKVFVLKHKQKSEEGKTYCWNFAVDEQAEKTTLFDASQKITKKGNK